MSADWWARGLSIGAVAIAFGGFIWARLEWRAAGRPRMKVIGSAGHIQRAQDGGLALLRGERFGEDWVIIDAINTSRRALTVESVGFLDYGGFLRRRKRGFYGIWPRAGQLPRRLDPGEKVSVEGDPKPVFEALRSGARLVPFCQDAEGRIHKGRQDEHFRRFARRAKEAADT
jgi:hypothetical protein